ncbi:hypothetical protein PsYK624_051830 [Phanerochaete sordida]|uniref:Uncharacterized protein n=1 Tax=Phanerochaete sordida TaxID=48140 RepID=A0A9P3G6D0_9APHY|nr:hypothetical protein PsYK624_051830 [Phanerochaete sordida]
MYEAGLKERFLGDEEIIEHVVENATSTIQWTIHRPKRGWYLRIRAPTFPPGSYITLTPVPQSSPYHADAALTFACRTNPPSEHPGSARASVSSPKPSIESDATLAGDASPHSYPPTPPTNPTVRILPPSPRSVQAKLAEIPEARPAAQVVTPFILTPHSTAHVPTNTQLSVFARVMAALKNHAPSHDMSFTLSPVPKVSQEEASSSTAPVPTPVPLLTYHDRTPAWTVGSTFGVLEVDLRRERELGVQPSFYVAIALTYLEFLEERESFLAAATD